MKKIRGKDYRFTPNYLPAKKRKTKSFKVILIGGLFFILVAGILYLLIFSPIFKINKIEVVGAKGIDVAKAEEIAGQVVDKKLLNKIPRNNVVLLPRQEISEAILDNFPKIKKIDLVENFFKNTLILKIEERIPSAIWCQVAKTASDSVSTSTDEQFMSSPSVENCFYIDDGGYLFEESPILSGGALAIVYQETDDNLEIGKNVSDSKMLEFILAAKKELTSINLNLTDFVVKSQTLGDLEILTPDNWRIYLSTENPVENQINALKRVLQEEIKEKRTQLEYVDLRVENRVYYKLKTP